MSQGDSFAEDTRGVSIWTLAAACGALVVAAIVLAGLFVSGAPGFTALQKASPVAALSAGSQNMNLTIVTNAGPQGDWPAFVPSSFSIPANQLVTITVTNLDGATPLPPALGSHAKVTGVVGGSETVVPISAGSPNSSKGKQGLVRAINTNQVSHTFTIPALGINVPVEAHSKISFTIRIAKPGTYGWQCFDPCGSGDSGTTGAMALPGYMEGAVTVTPA
jgi:hypothetical protein